jgi:hypothetical protein
VLSLLPERMRVLSRENATDLTPPVCPSKVRISAPVAASHSFSSPPPDSTRAPSAEKATAIARHARTVLTLARSMTAANVARFAVIDARIADIDKRLAAEFPDYAALASPAPVSVEDVQSLLRPQEALVLFLDTPELKPTQEETLIWVITKTDMRWARSELGTPSLRREVAALRCGLDYYGTWDSTSLRCSELLKTSYTEADH